MKNMNGKELIIDLKGCNVSKFTRESITDYFKWLCSIIGMERESLFFWDDEDTPESEKRTEPHVVGISAVQFIITSNITIHTLTLLQEAYINIFSCQDYQTGKATTFTKSYFEAREYTSRVIERGKW